MVAIKDFEMPSCCRKTITLGGTIIDIKLCPFYENCESEYHEIVDFNFKPSDCPLVEIKENEDGKA